jgi:uncharacterized protein (TIGR03437 family)
LPTSIKRWPSLRLRAAAISILIPACQLLAGTISVGTVTVGVSGGNADSSSPPAYVTNPSAFGSLITDGITILSGQQRRNTDPSGGANTILDAAGTFDGRQVTISGTISALTIADSQSNSGGHSQAFAIGLCTGGWRDQAGATYNLNLISFQPAPAKDGFAGVAFGFKNGSLYFTAYDYDNQPNQIFFDLGKAGLAAGQSITAPLAFTLAYSGNSMSLTLNGQVLGAVSTSHDFSRAMLVAMGASINDANGAGTMTLTNLTATTPNTTGPAVALYAISGDRQSAIVGAGTSQPLVIGVVDALRNPVPGVTVNFITNNATAAPALVQTDSTGRASTSVTLGATPGESTITAAAAGLPVVTFHLTAVSGSAPTIKDVVNGASLGPGIVSGSWAIIHGDNLAAATDIADSSARSLPSSLDNTSVIIDGIPASVYYVSPNQLNVIVPDDPAIGGLSVQVTTPGGASGVFTADKREFAPALFLFAGPYPFGIHTDGTPLGPPNPISKFATHPAKPGEIIFLFGTGFGPTDLPIAAGDLATNNAPLAIPVTATVGGLSADIQGYLIYPGLYQFALTVPNLPAGDATLVLTIIGSSTQDGLLLSIAR